jgi:hypothetical protein
MPHLFRRDLGVVVGAIPYGTGIRATTTPRSERTERGGRVAIPAGSGKIPGMVAVPCHHAKGARGEEAPVKKIIGWILLILLIFYIGTNPGPAADIAQSIGSGLAQAFRNIGVFFSNLVT